MRVHPNQVEGLVERWAKLPKAGKYLFYGAYFAFAAAGMSLISLFALIPDMAQPMPNTLYWVLLGIAFGGPSIFAGLALHSFIRWLRTPKRLGVGSGFVFVQWPLRAERLETSEICRTRTSLSFAWGGSFAIEEANGIRLRAVGLEIRVLEGLATWLRATNTAQDEAGPWAWTAYPDGRRVLDSTWAADFDAPLLKRSSQWQTPTRAAFVSQMQAGGILGITTILIVALAVETALPAHSPLGGIVPVGALIAAGSAMAAPRWQYLRRAPPTHGFSTLKLARGATRDEIEQAASRAFNEAGLPRPIRRESNRLLYRVLAMEAPGIASVKCRFPGTVTTSLELFTVDPALQTAHAFVKGGLLERVTGQASRTAASPAFNPAPGSRQTAPWNMAIRPDGSAVPDAGHALSDEGGSQGSTSQWVPTSARQAQMIGIFSVVVVGVFAWVLLGVTLAGLHVGSGAENAAVWSALVLSALTAGAAFPMLRGQYWYSVLSLPLAHAAPSAADSMVRTAAKAEGRRLVRKRQSLTGHLWRLDVPVWFRFVSVGAGTSPMLQIYAKGQQNLQTYARLKGRILESLEGGPSGLGEVDLARGPAVTAGVVDANRAWVAMKRGARPVSMENPPPWAMTVDPSGATARGDAPGDGQTVADLSPGHWYSIGGRESDRTWSRTVRLVTLPSMGGTAIVFFISFMGPPSDWTTTRTLVASTIPLTIFLAMYFMIFRGLRRTEAETRARNARSLLRLNASPEQLAIAVVRVDGAVRAIVPQAVTVPAPGGATARWEDPARSLIVTLRRGQANSPYIELVSDRPAPTVVRIKSAIADALFGEGS